MAYIRGRKMPGMLVGVPIAKVPREVLRNKAGE